MIVHDVAGPWERRLRWITIGVALCGAAARFIALDRHALTPDESVTWSLATSAHVIADVISRAHGEPPLNSVLAGVLARFSASVAFLRVLPAACSAGVVLLAAWLFRRWLPPVAAFLATLFLSGSAFQLYYGQELRAYALLALLALGVLAVHLEWLRLGRLSWRGWGLLAVLEAGCVYAHYMSVLYLAALALSVPAVGSFRRQWRPWLVSQVVAAALFAPWVPVLWQCLHTLKTAGLITDYRWWRDLPAAYVLLPLGKSLIPHPSHAAWRLEQIVCAASAVTTLAGMVAGIAVLLQRRNHPLAVLLAFALAVPMLLLGIVCGIGGFQYHYVYVRYAIWLHAPLALLIGSGLDVGPDAGRARRAFATVCVATWALANGWSITNYFADDEYLKGPDFESATARLSVAFRPGDQILCDSLVTYQPMRCYARLDPTLSGARVGLLRGLGPEATLALLDPEAIYPDGVPLEALPRTGKEWVILYHDWRARREAGFEEAHRNWLNRIGRATAAGDYVEEEQFTVRGLVIVRLRRQP